MKNGPNIVNRWLEHDRASIAHRLPRVSLKIVMGNAWKVDFHDCWISWKVTSTQNTSKMVPGDPSWLQTEPQWSLGSLGSLPWDPLGSQGFPSHGMPWAPLPWDPLGSLGFPSHGIPWAPNGPSHGVHWAPKGPLPWGPFGSRGPPPMVQTSKKLKKYEGLKNK